MTKPLSIAENNVFTCTGCMVCVDVCPTKAITEGFMKDGFRIPVVQEDRCIRCSKCMKACGLNIEKKVFTPIAVYRMAARDDRVRRQCSSGGIFALLSERMVDNGGIVVGACFDAEHKDIRHSTSTEVELTSIYRSKYAQSNTVGNYQKIARIKNWTESIALRDTMPSAGVVQLS